MKWFFQQYYALKVRFIHSYHYRFKNKKNSLKELLKRENKLRWLDMGSSINYNDGFHFADIYPASEAAPEIRDRYVEFNATKNFTDAELESMGKFDFIRMQHVFEHFTPEDSLTVLKNCHRLMNDGAYLLITVPDLKEHINRYRRKCMDVAWVFADWAHTRIPKGAPQSYYFSIFTHSVLYQSHLWCYDEEGLIYNLEQSGLFKDIRKVSVFDKLADIPFTHNRPHEDLCIIARKK